MSSGSGSVRTVQVQALAAADVRLLEEFGHGLKDVSPDNLHAIIDALVGGHTVSCAVPLTPLGLPPVAPLTRLETLQTLVLQYGVRRFVRSVERKVVRELQTAAGAASLTELQRLMEGGLLQFLSDRCPVNLLRTLCTQLGLEHQPRSDVHEATEREHQIADEIMLGGAEALLEALPPAMLRVLCKEVGLDVQPAATEDLADAILTHFFDLVPLAPRQLEAKRRRREDEQERHDRERARVGGIGRQVRGKSRYKAPPLSNIKKGITKQELHDLYNFTDLQEFCRAHGLDYTGKKAVLIRRIITFLDTGEKGAPKPRKRRHQ